MIILFPPRPSQFIAQDRPLHIPVCGISLQSEEVPQAPLRSRYKSRAFLGMRDDLFAQQLAQQQWILPSALCSSERWKLLPHITVMVGQPSALLRGVSHSRPKQSSFPVAAEALKEGDRWGKKHFRTCRDPQGSPRGGGITYLHSTMHALHPTCKAAL